MLAGAYPSDEFAELKPRLVWDRVDRRRRGPARRPGRRGDERRDDPGPRAVRRVPGRRGRDARPARRRARRGDGLRDAGAGEVITLGASSWRIEEIAHDRVTVSPAPGVPGKLPFWHGDAVGRPIELGRALGAFVREAEADLARGARGRAAATDAAPRDARPRRARGREPRRLPRGRARGRPAPCRPTGGSSSSASATSSATGGSCLLTPFGGRVHAPWSLAIEARLGERLGARGPDDLVRRRDRDPAARRRRRARRHRGSCCSRIPRRSRTSSSAQVASSALFASRFRENAARALLLPRRRPGTRTPLWQQRQRAADLLAVASPLRQLPDPRRDVPRGASRTCSTCRRCATSSAASPGARSRSTASRRRGRRRSRARSCSTTSPPTCTRATRRWPSAGPGALTLDRDLLRELLGQEELRELLDPDALADLELSLQALTDDRQATTVDQLHDLLRRLGDLSADEIAARCRGRRRGRRRLARRADRDAARGPRPGSRGDDRWIAIEDVARYRDGVGVAPPAGVPEAFLGPAAGALDGLLARWARTPRPVPHARAGRALGPAGRRRRATPSSGCSRPGRSCAASSGPGGAEREWMRPGRPPPAPPALARPAAAGGRAGRPGGARPVPAGVARRRADRRRPAAAPRVGRPRAPRRGRRPARGRADPGVGPGARHPAGADPRLPAAPARRARRARRGRRGSGAGSLGRDDGRIVLVRPGPRGAATVRRSRDGPTAARPDRATTRSAQHLAARGASFYRELFAAAGGGSDREVLDALWDLVWAGEVTNDTFAPLRALRWKRTAGTAVRRGRGARLTSLGPPEAAGRWSLVDARSTAVRPTERFHAPALALLERHGIADARSGGRRRHRGRLLRRSTRSCGRWRRRAGSGAATSSTGSARRSSRSPGRSTGSRGA